MPTRNGAGVDQVVGRMLKAEGAPGKLVLPPLQAGAPAPDLDGYLFSRVPTGEERAPEALARAIRSVVAKYNALAGGFPAEAEALRAGRAAVKRWKRAQPRGLSRSGAAEGLRRAFQASAAHLADRGLGSLAQAGIKVAASGQLALDEDALHRALTADFDRVVQLFAPGADEPAEGGAFQSSVLLNRKARRLHI